MPTAPLAPVWTSSPSTNQLTTAAASGTSSHGTHRARRARTGGTSNRRAVRRHATSATAPRVTRNAPVAAQTEPRRAAGVNASPGPTEPTRARAANQPPAIPAATTSATSSTAFPASAAGPTPRADNTVSSARRRSTQNPPAAPATTSPAIAAAAARGTTVPVSASTTRVARSVMPGRAEVNWTPSG
ncbi:hypothetical protein [Amycolatopsis ruanii]|uniref:hypothetical protein n=1 Tax=Amycolatopsis ruanii TaxID=944491 RepID=UPI000E22E4CA|nr:hypothetical protein [Amycolatopsis ruanii]